MFFSYSLKVVLGFANVTSTTACTKKLVNNIGLEKLRDGVFTTEKTFNFNDEKATTILEFLQYLSQICLSLILVAFEKAPIFGHLKYTFFIVINSVFIAFGSVLNFKKLFYRVIYNNNSVHDFL